MSRPRFHYFTTLFAPLLALFGVGVHAMAVVPAERASIHTVSSQTESSDRSTKPLPAEEAPVSDRAIAAHAELTPAITPEFFGHGFGPALDAPAPIGFVSTEPAATIAPTGLTTLRTDRHPPRNLPLLV